MLLRLQTSSILTLFVQCLWFFMLLLQYSAHTHTLCFHLIFYHFLNVFLATCGYVHVTVGHEGGPKGTSYLLKVEIEEVVTYLTRAVGSELRPSERTVQTCYQ